MALTGTFFVGGGLLTRRVDRLVSWTIGLNHSPGCFHRDSAGRIPVGTTQVERVVYKGFAIAGVIEIFLGLALIVGSFFGTRH